MKLVHVYSQKLATAISAHLHFLKLSPFQLYRPAQSTSQAFFLLKASSFSSCRTWQNDLLMATHEGRSRGGRFRMISHRKNRLKHQGKREKSEVAIYRICPLFYMISQGCRDHSCWHSGRGSCDSKITVKEEEHIEMRILIVPVGAPIATLVYMEANDWICSMCGRTW